MTGFDFPFSFLPVLPKPEEKKNREREKRRKTESLLYPIYPRNIIIR